MIAFLRLGRPLFLVGGAVFYGLGVAAAWLDAVGVAWRVALLGYLAVGAAQLMNHYGNDYYDLDADLATHTPTPWSGGSRVLAEGQLHPRVAFWAAVGFGLLALLFAGWAAVLSRAPVPSLGLLAAGTGLAWVYSGPPLYLHRRGLGELVGALVIPGLTAASGYLLQAGTLLSPTLLCTVPLALLQFAMLVAVSVPDAAGDAAVGKQTLVVLFGRESGSRLYSAAVLLAFLSLPLIWLAGAPLLAVLAPCVLAPVAVWNVWGALTGRWNEPRFWSGLGFWSIGQLVGSGGLMVVALTWLSLK